MMPITITDPSCETFAAPGRAGSALTPTDMAARAVENLPVPNSGSEPFADGGSEFSIPGLLRAFRRRYYIIVPLAVLAATIAGLAANQFLVTQTYQART